MSAASQEHPGKGQASVAFVSLKPGRSVAAEEVEAWARTVMGGYKVPRVALVSDFPMSTTGKIRKVEPAERAQRLADAGRG